MSSKIVKEITGEALEQSIKQGLESTVKNIDLLKKSIAKLGTSVDDISESIALQVKLQISELAEVAVKNNVKSLSDDIVAKIAKEAAEGAGKSTYKKLAVKIVAAAAVAGVGVLAWSAYQKYDDKLKTELTVASFSDSVTDDKFTMITLDENTKGIKFLKEDGLRIDNSDVAPFEGLALFRGSTMYGETGLEINTTVEDVEPIAFPNTTTIVTLTCPEPSYDAAFFDETGKVLEEVVKTAGSVVRKVADWFFDLAGVLLPDWVIYVVFAIAALIILSILGKVASIFKSSDGGYSKLSEQRRQSQDKAMAMRGGQDQWGAYDRPRRRGAGWS